MVFEEAKAIRSNNTYIKNNNFVSRKLKIFFWCLQTFFSLDFGFVAYKSIGHKICIKLCTASVAVFICVLCLKTLTIAVVDEIFIPWIIKDTIQYFIHVFVLLFTRKSTSFYVFLKSLYYIDSKLGIDSNSYRLETKIFSGFIASYFIKCLVSFVYSLFFHNSVDSFSTNLPFFVPNFSVDCPLIVFSFVFYASCSRLNTLRNLIKKKRFEPKYFQYLYMLLLDSTEKVKNAFDIIFILNLLINIPNIMLVIYQNIKQIKYEQKHTGTLLVESLGIFLALSITFAPAVAANSLSSEVDKIKITLHDNLLEEKDKVQCQDIERFINYLNVRSSKFYVLKILPQDASLPVRIINFCITYFIVICQTTHLY